MSLQASPAFSRECLPKIIRNLVYAHRKIRFHATERKNRAQQHCAERVYLFDQKAIYSRWVRHMKQIASKNS